MELATTKEVCIHFKKSRTTINTWMKKLDLKPIKVGGTNFYNIKQIEDIQFKYSDPIGYNNKKMAQETEDKWRYRKIEELLKEGLDPSLEELIFYTEYCKTHQLPDKTLNYK